MRKWVQECAVCHRQGYKPEMEKSDSYKSPVGSKLSRLVNKMILNDAECVKHVATSPGRFD
jgi:hypothetical protein